LAGAKLLGDERFLQIQMAFVVERLREISKRLRSRPARTRC
jgi:hypothetical protein